MYDRISWVVWRLLIILLTTKVSPLRYSGWSPSTAICSHIPIGSLAITPVINHDPSDIVVLLLALSERPRALLKEVPDVDGAKKRYLGVWSDSHWLEVSFEVTEIHGSFHVYGMLLIGLSDSNIYPLHPLTRLHHIVRSR